MDHFWDVSLANLVTWFLLVAGFVGSQYVAVKLLGARMNGFDEWKKVHEEEAREQSRINTRLEVTAEKLTVLAAASERRLERLEDR